MGLWLSPQGAMAALGGLWTIKGSHQEAGVIVLVVGDGGWGHGASSRGQRGWILGRREREEVGLCMMCKRKRNKGRFQEFWPEELGGWY